MEYYFYFLCNYRILAHRLQIFNPGHLLTPHNLEVEERHTPHNLEVEERHTPHNKVVEPHTHPSRDRLILDNPKGVNIPPDQDIHKAEVVMDRFALFEHYLHECFASKCLFDHRPPF